MKYKVETFVEELLEGHVITQELAWQIETHFAQKKTSSDGSRLLSIFGVLGAVLVGIGIMLIVAHNWDNLSRSLKSVFAFIPVILGLLACAFALMRKSKNFAWTEGASIFLALAIGSCIALISQIYNIPGSPADFLLTWCLMGLPIVYLMGASVTSILYVVGITFFVMVGEFPQVYYFWLLLLAILPFYYLLYQKNQFANTLYFHHWVVPFSVIVSIIRGGETTVGWLAFPTLIVLFGAYYAISTTKAFDKLSLFSNGYRIIGSFGTVVVLMVMSFYDLWKSFAESIVPINDYISSYYSIILVVAALTSGYFLFRNKITDKSWMHFTWIVFLVIFVFGYFVPIAGAASINLLLLAFAVFTIYKGVSQNHLGIVNYGLLTISVLIISRFFDIQIPFIVRGLIFIGLGCLFFLVNYKLVQQRKLEAN